MAYKPNILALADGGTNAALTASNGGIFYSTASAGAILAGTATAGQVLRSGASTTPAWSTATYPATATGTGTILRADGTNWVATTSTYPNTNSVSTLLYASSANVMSELTTANDGILVTSHTGVPSILAGPGAAGKVLQSNAAAAPSYSTATYPSTATGTGTILRADGTNWVATTSTYPNTNAINTLLYASSANVMSALATANSGVLSTNSSGVPSIDTTNFAVLSTGLQLKGNNTNTAPPAGFIGEQIRSFIASGSAVSLSTTVCSNITSIILTAGIWDISAVIKFVANSATSITLFQYGISPTSATMDTFGDDCGTDSHATAIIGYGPTRSIPAYRVTLSGNTTYYLVALGTFTVNTLTAYGRISATRVG